MTLASMTLTRWLKHESVETAARITGLNTPWPRNRNQRHETPRYGLECTVLFAASKPEAILQPPPPPPRSATTLALARRAGMCACRSGLRGDQRGGHRVLDAVVAAVHAVDRFDTLCRKRDLARENIGKQADTPRRTA